MADVNSNEDIIDSRDVIERIAELEAMEQEFLDGDKDAFGRLDDSELFALRELAEQADTSPDWHHGETLIRASYFETYMDDMIDDCYDIPELPSFMTITLDYDALRTDYMDVEFDGVEYLIRA